MAGSSVFQGTWGVPVDPVVGVRERTPHPPLGSAISGDLTSASEAGVTAASPQLGLAVGALVDGARPAWPGGQELERNWTCSVASAPCGLTTGIGAPRLGPAGGSRLPQIPHPTVTVALPDGLTGTPSSWFCCHATSYSTGGHTSDRAMEPGLLPRRLPTSTPARNSRSSASPSPRTCTTSQGTAWCLSASSCAWPTRPSTVTLSPAAGPGDCGGRPARPMGVATDQRDDSVASPARHSASAI